MNEINPQEITLEWLTKNRLAGPCKSCGVLGIYCDDDYEIFYMSRFYPVKHLVNNNLPKVKHIDDRTELCDECIKTY